MSAYTQKNHAAPLARSSSFLGAIKSIVAAPFSWFAGPEDEFEDARGKRRRLPVVIEDAYLEDEGTPSRSKRQRLGSPDADRPAYLDPPRSAFAQPRRTSDRSSSSAGCDNTRSPRKTLHLPSASNQPPRSRRTLSPLPSGSHLRPQGITRTMSLDPPSHSSFLSRIQPAPTIPDLQSEASHAPPPPTSREVSMSPRHIRVRSSLTPQPSGTTFGPVVPPRRERAPDEPPPLTTLMSNPMFVKPPHGVQKHVASEPSPQLTLGTLLDSQRTARAPTRQSSILFGTGSMTDVSARHLWPVNKAEVALHELEVYKTPLLPTRLKGSVSVPDMFVHKESKHITLMTDDRPTKPRLGTKGKGKEKGRKRDRETVNGRKPYAGEGGMKKWLARRKKEEEEARERERADAMEDERTEEEEKRKEAETEKKREEDLKAPPPAPLFEPRVSREGPLSSSLRVGRTRTGRNHIDRPLSRRAKFSAAFEEEDEEMEEVRAAEQKELEEAAKKVPAFELPAGFSFAKETTITHDLTRAKEPPIISLPFSLTKPASAPPTIEIAKPSPAPAPPTPAPVVPKIALVPPTPEAAKPLPEAPVPPVTVASIDGVPNFFANSSVFAKPAPMTASPFNAPVAEQVKPTEVREPQPPKAGDSTPSIPDAPSQPTSVFATLIPTGAPPAAAKETEKSVIAAPNTALPFTFGTPAKPVESVPASGSGAPSEQPPAAEPKKPASTPFSFGAPPSVPSAPATALAPVVPATSTEAQKSASIFGRPTSPGPVVPQVTSDTAKSLFGTPPPAPSGTPFTFLPRPGAAPVENKSTAIPFSFGTPSTAEKKPTTGFNFGSSTTSATTAASPATFSFSATPSGTTAAHVSSKPFVFGSTPTSIAPARPVTPPKAEQEVTMDESPVRDMMPNGDGKAPERPTLSFTFNTPGGSALFAQSPATTTAPFSFGATGATANPFAKEEKKETKPPVSFSSFGQTSSSSTGFSFGQKPPESPVTTTTAAAPFQFSQPSPNVAPTSPFSFGAPPPSANPFGQGATASTPSSPSTFNRPASSSFGFGTPTTVQPTPSPFAFGPSSQPASPVTGNTTLPSGTAGSSAFSFGAGVTGATAPATGFGAPAGAAAPGGGSLFTMGSVQPQVDGAGARRIKGLPRRGARRG